MFTFSKVVSGLVCNVLPLSLPLLPLVRPGQTEDRDWAGGGPGAPGGELPGGGVGGDPVPGPGPDPGLVGGGGGQTTQEVALDPGLAVVRNDEGDPVLPGTSQGAQAELQEKMDDWHPALS